MSAASCPSHLTTQPSARPYAAVAGPVKCRQPDRAQRLHLRPRLTGDDQARRMAELPRRAFGVHPRGRAGSSHGVVGPRHWKTLDSVGPPSTSCQRCSRIASVCPLWGGLTAISPCGMLPVCRTLGRGKEAGHVDQPRCRPCADHVGGDSDRERFGRAFRALRPRAAAWGRAARAPNCPVRIPPVRDSNARVGQGHPTTTTTEAP